MSFRLSPSPPFRPMEFPRSEDLLEDGESWVIEARCASCNYAVGTDLVQILLIAMVDLMKESNYEKEMVFKIIRRWDAIKYKKWARSCDLENRNSLFNKEFRSCVRWKKIILAEPKRKNVTKLISDKNFHKTMLRSIAYIVKNLYNKIEEEKETRAVSHKRIYVCKNYTD